MKVFRDDALKNVKDSIGFMEFGLMSNLLSLVDKEPDTVKKILLKASDKQLQKIKDETNDDTIFTKLGL